MREVMRAMVCGVVTMGALTLASAASHAQMVLIGGTGMGLAAMQHVGENLAAADPGFAFEVLPSLGTSGGIKALAEGAIDVAIAGRALKPEEQALEVGEAACLTTALIFATSHETTENLASADLPGIYANPSPQWKDGTPLKIILRSRTGSENPYLVATVPGIEEPMNKAYDRPGIPVGSTDQETADLATQTDGSLAVMTLLQLRAEELKLQVLPLDGVAATSATLADQTYPMPLRVCLLLRTNPRPEAVRFVEHVKSDAGQSLLKSFEAIPSN